jgi:Tol biopolymer transport system component
LPRLRISAKSVLCCAAALVISVLAAAGCGSSVPAPRGEIVFTALAVAGSGRDVYAIDADGVDLRRLTRDGGDSDPAWSPSSAEIAFTRWSSAGCTRPRRDCSRIWIMASDGSRGRPLTAPSHRSEEPAWSPGGDEIAYVRWRDDANPYAEGTDIYAMRADGSHERRLTRTGDNADPAWSPDGARIAFTSDLAGNYDIYVMSSDGSGVRRLTNAPVPELAPAWSRDGRRIAYAAPDGIHVIDADGSDDHLLVKLRGATDPAWSPDGRALIVGVDTPLGDDLYTVAANGAKPKWLDVGLVTEPSDPGWAAAQR